jgi:histidinol-phosphate aminotransferase
MSTTIASQSVGPPVGARVRLSSNESPFGPSPAAISAMQAALEEANRYPDDQSEQLRAALAEHEGVGFDQVAVGNGSAAILMDLVPHLCDPDDEVLTFAHSFIVYRLGAKNAGASYVEVEDGGPAHGGQDGYARDVEALLARITQRTRLILIDNPGNPTGAHLTSDELTALIAGVPEHVTIAIDEAYHHFATGQRGYRTVAELDVEHPRLLSLKTFSKAFALAGLRIGYVTGPADLIGPLDAWRPRFNVTSVSQAAAVASLGDTDHLERTIDGTLAGRERMAEGLRELGVPFTDGLGNFLTVECGTAAAPIVEAYGQAGVGVRTLPPYGMDEQFRATVGTPEETEEFLRVSADVLADLPSRT